MKKLIAALLLLASSVVPAYAGDVHATIEGPASDGVTYTVRAVDCPDGVTLKPWVCADGLDGRAIQSIRLDLQPTAEKGVYTFRRGWPQSGDWMLRVCLGDPLPGPATIAAVSRDGRVQKNQLFWNTYGVQECRLVLKGIAKKRGIALDEGC